MFKSTTGKMTTVSGDHSLRISGRVREGSRNGYTRDLFGTEEFPFPKAGGRRE